MERKIGEVFTYKGKTYKVVERSECENCDVRLHCISASSIAGTCFKSYRSDNTNIIFKEINNMENNQLTIAIPEGMEIDLENSDLTKGIVKFKQSTITYENVEDALNLKANRTGVAADINNISKLSALDKLMNIAKYYNGDWEPDWRSIEESKSYIYYCTRSNTYGVANTYSTKYGNIYFRSYEDAQSVIDNPNFRPILDAVYKN